MNYAQSAIDVLRACHLVFFAAGMGTAAYFDFQRFSALNQPLKKQDIQELTRLHIWISSAFSCLWITGMLLIYVRTSFDVSEFSPKLWLKIGIMTFMILVSRSIGKVVIPVLNANVGRSLISIPKTQLLLTTQIGVLSMFCWTSGLFLGSSVVLKTAHWDVLLPLALGWCLLLTFGGQTVLLLVKKRCSGLLAAK